METTSEASGAEAERSSTVHLGGRPWRPPWRTRRWRAAAISGSPMRPARACQSAAVKLERAPKWATTCCRGPVSVRTFSTRDRKSTRLNSITPSPAPLKPPPAPPGHPLPVRCGEVGKGSQVGDDLLPGTGVGANVLDKLPVAVGLATLFDDRTAEKHGLSPEPRLIAQEHNGRGIRIDQGIGYDLSLHAFFEIFGA